MSTARLLLATHVFLFLALVFDTSSKRHGWEALDIDRSGQHFFSCDVERESEQDEGLMLGTYYGMACGRKVTEGVECTRLSRDRAIWRK